MFLAADSAFRAVLEEDCPVGDAGARRLPAFCGQNNADLFLKNAIL